MVPAGADPRASPVDPCLLASGLAGDAVLGYHAGLERTLVDLFDRPDLGGGFEEVWRSLATVECFELDAVTEYAALLGNATTVAKVGFFLEAHRERLMVSDAHLARLRRRRPRQPHYFEKRDAGKGRLAARRNLVVPDPTHAVARPVGTLPTLVFPILDIHELAAGKLAALLARRATRASPSCGRSPRSRGLASEARKGTRQVHFGVSGGFVATPVSDRGGLGAGHRFDGPPIVEEMDSTTLVLPDYAVEVDRYGNLLISPAG